MPKPAEIVGIVIILALAGVAVWYVLNMDKAAAADSPLAARVPGVPLGDDPTAIQRGDASVAGIKNQSDLLTFLRAHGMMSGARLT